MPEYTLGRVLYDDIARKSTSSYVYSGTEVSGFDVENAFDLRSFSKFRQTAGTQTITITVGEDITLNEWFAYWVNPLYSGASTFEIKIEVDTGSGYVTADTFNPATFNDQNRYGNVRMREIGPYSLELGDQVRYSFTVPSGETLDIRSLMAGERLEFEIGQHSNIAPGSFTGGLVTTNTISINGSALGRAVRRQSKSMEIELEYLSDTWVRTYWEPFAEHASTNWFAYSWDEDGHPNDAVFASATEINRPENSSPIPKLSVTMPLEVIN